MEYEMNRQNQEKDELFFTCVKKITQTMHMNAIVKAKCKEVQYAIACEDKGIKWRTLQKYLNRYTNFINNLADLTNVYVYQVDKDYYINVTEKKLNKQLQMVINFVYLKELLHLTSTETIKATLKFALKKTGQFTDKELSIL